jgi:hypothetical protein
MSHPSTVLMSYSKSYRKQAWELADRLRADGINCIDDRACPPGTDWQLWILQQIDHADFVLLIGPNNKTQSVTSFSRAAGIIERKIYENPRSTKIVPIVFWPEDRFEQPRLSHYYPVIKFPGDYDFLYRLLREQQDLRIATINEFRID